MPWYRENDELRLNGSPHYDEATLKSLIERLRVSRAGKPAWICERLLEILSSGRAPKVTIQRLSKWCHYKGSKMATDLAQRISRELFNGEVSPRLLNSRDEPSPDATTAEFAYEEWLERVCTASKERQLRSADQDSVSSSEEQKRFDHAVSESRKGNPDLRRARLREAGMIPAKHIVIQYEFRRNPDVVAEVLERAQGTCESCKLPAPFRRLSDGTPYLEVHHKRTLADGGEDTISNAIALCPNCHRKEHYG